MNDHHREKVSELIVHLASEFISREGNRNSMITVTNLKSSEDLKYMTIFVSVFPENQTNAALDFLKRNRSDFKAFVKEKTKIHPVPFFDFENDLGEKARQRVEEISQNL